MSPTATPKSPFCQYLIALNRPHLDNFQQWLFLPGMLFGSLEKWWGDHGPRPASHEGLDLCRFAEVSGATKILDRHTQIPAAFAGEIVKIVPDFLGQSIFIRHAIFDGRGHELYSAYGHTQPVDFLQVGSQVSAGTGLATLADFANPKPAVLPHVHLTFAWMPGDLDITGLNWDNIGKNPDITLIDPVAVLDLSV
jgi:hypothetical protein